MVALADRVTRDTCPKQYPAAACSTCFRPAQVAPVELVGAECGDAFAPRGQTQIRRDDGECAFFLEQRKNAGRDHVNPGERERNRIGNRPNHLSPPITTGDPPAKLAILIEEQRSRGGPMLDRQRGQRTALAMSPHHACKVDGAQHIHVVQQKRSCGIGSRLLEKPCSLLQPAACVQQFVFARNFNAHVDRSVRAQPIFDAFRVVMSVDDDFADADVAQAGQRDFQHGAPAHFHQRFGTVIGSRAQARAQSGGQHHRLHRPIFSSSMWRTSTSTPGVPRRRDASCSAR